MAARLSPPVPYPYPEEFVTETPLQAVPATIGDVVTGKDVVMLRCEVYNNTAGAITIKIYDKTAVTPLPLLDTTVAANGGSAGWSEPHRGKTCKGGITWLAGSAGLVGNVIYVSR